ncbi:MAG: hypothetical protein AAF804_10710 [Bacteroidota bacterium]
MNFRWYLTYLLFLLPGLVWSQGDFETCAALYIDGKQAVDEYSPRGIIKITPDTRGMLTVKAWTEQGPQGKPLLFQVVLQDGKTNTLALLNKASVTRLELGPLLSQVNKGDKLLILTEDHQYSLPHHEIQIDWP